AADSDALRVAANELTQKVASQNAVVVLFAVANDRPVVLITASAEAQSAGIKAGELVSIAAKILGGGGGGKPAMAQGGGTDISQIDNALAAIKAHLS
ncbi:MAG: DHHA1 domain-containing protein, partial [Arcanobacterium sp.]|nr:DHHA1 domain-containing protein [Arcanobacterium sp.]